MSLKSKRLFEEMLASCKTLLFDVEGTTTSISFVKDTLFPYVRSNLETYVKKQWSSEEFKTDLRLLREQAVRDAADGVEGCVVIPQDGSDDDLQAAVVANVLWQMDGDRKTKALKQLQGHVMRDGYECGQLTGHVYPDVAPAMRSWVENGLKLYIYSSGSVEAQKLLFGHTEQGNLLQMFQGHFDTEIGSKQDVASYISISKLVACSPSEVIFFTDIPAEAMAAEGAGMSAVLVVREENTPLSEDDRALYQVIDSFEGFLCASPLKRRKVSDDAEVPSTDVEMNDVSEVSAPVTPDKLVEKDATNNSETDIEKKIEANMDISITDVKSECKPPTVDEPQTTEEKESPTKGIEECTTNGLKMAETPNSKPEEDMAKEVVETEHASTGKIQTTTDQVETENSIKLPTSVENGDPTKLSTTVEPSTETKSIELEAAAENNCDGGEEVSMLSNVEALEAPLEKAMPEKTVIEEDKVTKMVVDEVRAQIETSQANSTEHVKKDEADKEKVVLTEVKEAVEEKEATSPIGETKDKVEKMEECVPQPIDAVLSQDTERIAVEVDKEPEPNSSTDERGSMEENVIGKVDMPEKIEITGTQVEGDIICLEKSDIKLNVESCVSDKMDTKTECDLIEKTNNTIDTNVEEVAERVDTIIDGTVSEKEIHSTETKVETDVSEKSGILDTVTGNDQEEPDKLNSVVEVGQGDAGTLVELSKNVENGVVEVGQGDAGTLVELSKNVENGVEVGQGDAGTLAELSKNVENGKDSLQVEEVKVKKMLADNTSDDTENAMPITMET